MPIPGFAINDSDQCFSQNNFGFTNTSGISSGMINTNQWFFGDGNSSLFASPNHTYLIPDDTFKVKLITTSALGCVDSINKTTYVFPMPVPDFTINDSNQCFSQNSFAFPNNSIISSGS